MCVCACVCICVVTPSAARHADEISIRSGSRSLPLPVQKCLFILFYHTHTHTCTHRQFMALFLQSRFISNPNTFYVCTLCVDATLHFLTSQTIEGHDQIDYLLFLLLDLSPFPVTLRFSTCLLFLDRSPGTTKHS